jgi:hypothetical protein
LPNSANNGCEPERSTYTADRATESLLCSPSLDIGDAQRGNVVVALARPPSKAAS